MVKPVAESAAVVPADPSARPGLLAGTARLVKRAVATATDRYRQFVDVDVDAHAIPLDDDGADVPSDSRAAAGSRGLVSRQEASFVANEGIHETSFHAPKPTSLSGDMPMTVPSVQSSNDTPRSTLLSRFTNRGQAAASNNSETAHLCSPKSETEDSAPWVNPFESKRIAPSNAESGGRSLDVFGAAPFRKKTSAAKPPVVSSSEDVQLQKKSEADVFSSAPFMLPAGLRPSKTTSTDSIPLVADREKSNAKASGQVETVAAASSGGSGSGFGATNPAVPQQLAGSADLYGSAIVGSGAFTRPVVTDGSSKHGPASATAKVAPSTPSTVSTHAAAAATPAAAGRPVRPDSGTLLSSPSNERNSSPFAPAAASRQPFRQDFGSVAGRAEASAAGGFDHPGATAYRAPSVEGTVSPHVHVMSSGHVERDEPQRSTEDGYGSLKKNWRGSRHRSDKESPSVSTQFANLGFTDDPDALFAGSAVSAMPASAFGSAVEPAAASRQLSLEGEPKSPLAGGDESNCLIPSSSNEGSHTVPRSFSRRHRQAAAAALPVVIPLSPTEVEPFSVKKKGIALL